MISGSKLLRRLTMLCALTLLATTAGANPPGLEKAAEYASHAFDKQAALDNRAQVHAWLMSESVARGRGAPIQADVSASEMAAIDNAPRGQAPERVGLTKPVSVSVSFSDVRPGQLRGRALGRSHGAMTGTSDGGFVYTTTLASADATALRVRFTGFDLPENSGIYLYTDNGQVFGPYTGRGVHGDGEFWSHTVMGDNVYLQLRHVGPVTAADLRNTRFNVNGLGHVRPRFMGHCSGNAACVVNADCSGANAAVDPARDAVAHMQWVSGPYIYICTGGLIADSDTGTEIPYFLTANHCISRGKDARNLENFFQLTSPCLNPEPDPLPNCDDIFDHMANHPQSLRTLGATIKSTGRATDHTLMELKEPAPGGSTFLGWNSDPVAFNHGEDLYRISHPGGATQAYSAHLVDANVGTCQSWPRGDRIYSEDTAGATEGGSSGSPVVNASSQIVGQLSGACGYDLGDVCNTVDNRTVDGAFAAYFSEVAQFLDPGTSCTPDEEPEISCSDGVDNDCDGFIDGADTDCDPGGGLGQPGDQCEVNGDCASNKCKGKPGAKTCR